MQESSGSKLTDTISLPLVNPDHSFMEELSSFSRQLDEILNKVVNQELIPDTEMTPGIFTDPGMHFLTLTTGREPYRYNSQHITVDEEDGRILYIAKEAGYLYLNNKGKISLFSGQQHDRAKMNLFYIIMPVAAGKKEMSADLQRSFDKYGTLIENSSYVDAGFLIGSLNQNYAQSMVLKMGINPRPGVDGQLIVHKKPEKKKPGENEDHSRFFGGKPTIEVKEGELLAEKIPAKEGRPGFDIFGTELPVKSVKDVIFSPGNNIRTEIDETTGKESYFAAITGLLDYHPTRMAIIENMNIEGDVGPSTGDVIFSRDIIVKGNIQAGFSVECGGNLTINGNIENGARVFCKGKLLVMKGALGEETQIKTEHDARFSYIQNASVFVKGNAYVEKFIYNSNFFCGKELTVEGSHSETASHGSIVGGHVCAMDGMILHSAGSRAVKTTLVIGINENIVQAIKKIKEITNVLSKKILILQDSIGFDLRSEQFKERFRSMSSAQQDIIRKKMTSIKKLAVQKMELEKKLPLLQKEAYSEKDDIALIIEKNLIPELIIRIRDRHYLIQNEMERKKIVLDNGIVRIKDAEKYRR